MSWAGVAILFADEETEAGECLPYLLLTASLERAFVGLSSFCLPTHLPQCPLPQD